MVPLQDLLLISILQKLPILYIGIRLIDHEAYGLAEQCCKAVCLDIIQTASSKL